MRVETEQATNKYDRMLSLIRDVALLDTERLSDCLSEVVALIERAKILSQPKGINNIDLAAARGRAAATNRKKGEQTYALIMPLIDQLIARGITEYKAIAIKLNEDGVATPKGASWHAASVRRLCLIARDEGIKN